MTQIKIKILDKAKDLPLPSYATEHSAGADLVAAVDKTVNIQPGERALVATGICIALPINHEAQIRPRSGLAVKHGLTVLNAPGTIDADYRGELIVCLINHGEQPFAVERGMRIAQLVIAPFIQGSWAIHDDLEATERGKGRFGSTGLKAVV